MKKKLAIIVFLIAGVAATSAAWYISKLKPSPSRGKAKPAIYNIHNDNSWASTTAAAKLFARENNFNTDWCFLINMKLESGRNRFFVYNLKTSEIVNSGLVTHGRCNQSWLTGRKYGNTVGCGCTSLGKYRVGASYFGQFGLAYKLHGMDSSNSNAFKRFVVLHSHECVPAQEVSPLPICQSDGCPTVSPSFLKELQVMIDKSSKPVLLWIFE